MFIRNPDGVYQSTLLLDIPGVRHGFASRQAGAWPGGYTGVRQIHSDIVVVASDEPPPQGDALISADADRWIGVRTADCVPVLIADVAGGAVAAVHAGWRGTAAAIAAKTVERMRDVFGSSPGDLVAAIGPSIGPCCYEVGPEVAENFHWMPALPENGRFLDLVEANRLQLQAAGIRPERIDVSGFCTKCCSAEFHSYRRDKEASGRMVAAIALQRT